jgi:succinate dehydrogenase / fumarate reductase cytochrome b subunit
VINFLRSLPFVEYIEWLVLFIPIGFHALYGLIIYSTAQPNHMQRPHLENFRYILQRATGIIALVYIYYHIMQFKTVHDLDYNYIAKTLAGTETISWLPAIPYVNPFSVYWFYVVSLLSINYHFANGLWGFCITWGITIGRKSQQAVSMIGVVVFAVLSYIGIETINHLANVGAGL